MTNLDPDSGNDPGRWPRVSPVRAGLTCKCPRCGQGALFAGFLTVAERCTQCGFDLKKADSGDGPAVFIIFIMGALVVPFALLLESLASPPLWLHMVIWAPVIIGGSGLLLRPMKGLLIALQFHHRASDSGTETYE